MREAAGDRPGAVADETRAHRRASREGVLAALIDAGFTGTVARVACHDSFIPLGEAAARAAVRGRDRGRRPQAGACGRVMTGSR